MDGVCHLEQGHGAPEDLCAKVWCKTPFMIWDFKFGFGVLGHQGMGVARWPLRDGWSLPSGAGTWGTRGLARGVGLGSLWLGWAPWGVGHGFLLGVRWLGIGVGQLGQLTGLKLAWRKLGFVGVCVRGVTYR